MFYMSSTNYDSHCPVILYCNRRPLTDLPGGVDHPRGTPMTRTRDFTGAKYKHLCVRHQGFPLAGSHVTPTVVCITCGNTHTL